MKRLFAVLFSFFLYYCGHIVSYFMFDMTAHIVYPMYNFLMGYSLYIQDKYQIIGPWEKPETEEQK